MLFINLKVCFNIYIYNENLYTIRFTKKKISIYQEILYKINLYSSSSITSICLQSILWQLKQVMYNSNYIWVIASWSIKILFNLFIYKSLTRICNWFTLIDLLLKSVINLFYILIFIKNLQLIWLFINLLLRSTINFFYIKILKKDL